VTSPADDVVLPFMTEAGAIRGRVVRLGAALDGILAEHAYPQAVAERLGETLVLAAALAGALKYQGVFTLQVQSKGAIPLIVADVTSDGEMRGYARFDAELLAKAEQERALPPVPRYLSKGVLAFTVDQGADTDRYQGIVELTGDTLTDCATEYFRKSEQLETAFRMAVRPAAADHGWQAAAVMIQRMPLGPNSPILTAEQADESWRSAVILLASTKDAELFDTGLAPDRLAYRLYHADGLQTHQPRPLVARCRCSADRVAGTLRSFPRAEVDSMKDETGQVIVVCEFCKSRYAFNDQDLDRLYAS